MLTLLCAYLAFSLRLGSLTSFQLLKVGSTPRGHRRLAQNSVLDEIKMMRHDDALWREVSLIRG